MRHSQDLKRRVLQFMADGGSKAEAARRFTVHRSTIFIWLKQPSDHQPKKTGPRNSYKFDREALRQLIEKQPDLLLREMAAQFGVSVNTVHHALKRMRISRKKNTDIQTKTEI